VLIPIGQPLDIPISVVFSVGGSPVVTAGTLLWYEPGETVRIALGGDGSLPAVDTEVRIHGVLDTTLRMSGPTIAQRGRTVEIFPADVEQHDLRRHRRAYGGLELRYLVVPEDDPNASHRWMMGAADLETRTGWREPEPFMEFSASGVRFDDVLACQLGNIVLLELRLPSEEHGWRAVGRVVRIEGMQPRPKTGPGYHIALELTELPEEASVALTKASAHKDTEGTSGR